MKKRLVSSVLLITLLVSTLTGCSNSQKEISNLNSLQALNTDSSVTDSYSLSFTDEQNLIYAQVTDRTLLDLSSLEACTEDELQQVVSYMNSVDQQLTGSAEPDDAIIDEKFTDYLLAQFEQTPYYWQRSKMQVRGIDAESRSIIVDVTYDTIDYKKDVKKKSFIARGCPDYSKLTQIRYEKYCNILSKKLLNTTETWKSELKKFEEVYGKTKDIYESQSNYGLTENVYETGNQKTYTGLVNSDEEQVGASMTVRYILVPNYVLGINLGMTCQHMYVTSYALNEDPTKDRELFKDEGYATVTDSVYALIYSYFNCIDESDYDGLYKLTDNFGDLDKYFEDMFDTTYTKHNNFTLSVFNIQGTQIECGVTSSVLTRARGSNMTYPTYTDRDYIKLELVDGELKITDDVLLSRKIEGEPAITTADADTSGFVASIDLDNEARQSIEKLICDFGALQLNKDVTSDAFGDVVDISMATSDLTKLQTNMTSLTGKEKVVFLTNYQQGTENYASVKCKEMFQSKDNSIVEAETTYSFMKKGGKWYIYQYDINSTVKLDSTNLNTTGCLALISPGKVESYTSQVKATTDTSKDNKSDITVAYDYDHYKPSKKKGNNQQGFAQKTKDNVSDTDMTKMFKDLGTFSDSNASTVHANILKIVSVGLIDNATAENIYTVMKEANALIYNCQNNLYNDKVEKSKALDSFSESTLRSYVTLAGTINSQAKGTSSEEFAHELNDTITSLATLVKQYGSN